MYRWEESNEKAEYTNWKTGGPGGYKTHNCIRKTYYSAKPGWHDAICSKDDQDILGPRHALCQGARRQY